MEQTLQTDANDTLWPASHIPRIQPPSGGCFCPHGYPLNASTHLKITAFGKYYDLHGLEVEQTKSYSKKLQTQI